MRLTHYFLITCWFSMLAVVSRYLPLDISCSNTLQNISVVAIFAAVIRGCLLENWTSRLSCDKGQGPRHGEGGHDGTGSPATDQARSHPSSPIHERMGAEERASQQSISVPHREFHSAPFNSAIHSYRDRLLPSRTRPSLSAYLRAK